MVLESNVDVLTSTTPLPPTTTRAKADGAGLPDNEYTSYPTDTIAAVTIAILAVVIVLTLLLVFRALRKRRRARQGEQFGENVVPTITTGVMGTGAAAYASRVQVGGPVSWESVNPSSSRDSQAQPAQGTS